MIAACRRAKVKLMIAYRLHFEALNLEAMDLARQGKLGELKFFNSSFSMTVRRGDIRTKRAYGGGTLYDIGVYCINAARNLFRAEPTQVSAVSINSGLASLAEIDETTAATLRFGDDQVATFITSFNASDVAAYRIVGTKGDLHADPAYEYAEGLEYRAHPRRQDETEGVRQARSVRAGAAVLLGLHPEESRAGAVRRRRPAGRAHRPGALQVGEVGPAGSAPSVHEAAPAYGTSANHTSGRKKAGAGQSAERERELTALLPARLPRVQVDVVERHVPVRHQELEAALFLALELGAVGIQLRDDLFLGRRGRPHGGLDQFDSECPVGASVAVILWHVRLD